MDLVSWAEGEAQRRLEPLGRRWEHVRAVGARAREVAGILEPQDHELLVAAALLHDIGYDPELEDTGFHPIDGARWIASEGHPRLAGLVAHHSRALYEAEERGLREALDEFPDEASPVSDALAYCDLTTGPRGQRITAVERMRDMEQRYGAESLVSRAVRAASADLLAMVERTESRLQGAGTS
jgi:predicted hydrolase (HD superfamily)